jgi:DNA anti-recombination protein RmuC
MKPVSKPITTRNKEKLEELEDRLSVMEEYFANDLMEEIQRSLSGLFQDHKDSIEKLAENNNLLNKKVITLIEDNQQLTVMYLQLMELLREKKIIEGSPTGIQRIH